MYDSRDGTILIRWIDARPCPECGYGQLAVFGPVYGPGYAYVIKCINCKSALLPGHSPSNDLLS